MKFQVLSLVFRGALSMSAWVAGLFFLRFWRATADRFFLFLCVAFWLLSLNWLSLALLPWAPETQHQVFILRLLAFLLIIIGIIDKNRRAEDAAPPRERRNSPRRSA